MYLGIVVQNNDPEFRGRVKVYVPHIQANVYQGWYKEITNKNFKFLGKNIQSDLEKILPELKTVLPWAENSMPMIGATGSGRYNAHDKVGTISDSNRNETLKPNTHVQTEIEKKYKLNPEHIGEKPGKVYESHSTWVNDAFTNTQSPDDNSGDFAELETGDRLNGVNRPNKYAYNYQPNTYSNQAKGGFSIPNVGSHVWVFFQWGDPLRPVVFGVSYGQEDWKGIYDCQDEHGMDYPGTFENISRDEERVYDNNTETYRNKYVINQKGGTLEFVNTDNRELLKMTHYSGSFIEFNNHTNIEFATRNTQRLVQEDEYDTVNGFRNMYTGRDLDYIVRGDRYNKVGYMNTHYHEQWRESMRPLAEVKGLFEIQRMDGKPAGRLKQKQDGSPLPCPVCFDINRTKYWRNQNTIVHVDMTDTWSAHNGATTAYIPLLNSQGYYNPYGEFGGPKMNSILFKFKPTEYKAAMEREIIPPIPVKAAIPLQTYVIHDVGQNRDWNKVAGIITLPGEEPPTYVKDQTIFVINNQEDGDGLLKKPTGQIFGEKCPVCNGKGLSPSSMEGIWTLEEKKSDDEFKARLEKTAASLAPIESQLGLGGCEIINIAKHKVENVGLVTNDFPSVRIDPVGKMYRDQVRIHTEGLFVSQKPTPLLEAVHVDDLPGGSYSLNVANRWNVQVGAGGINIKTLGRVELAGAQVNVAGSQVNIGSESEVNIDGGKRLNIVSDIISIRQRDRGQVLVDSNLGVSQNVIIGGGLHVEGELSAHHLTLPVEIHETEKARIFSKLLRGLTFKCDIGGGTHVVSPHGGNHPSWSGATVKLTAHSNDDHVVDYGHSHLFKNGAMHLMDNNDSVRNVGKGCEQASSRVRSQDVEVVQAKNKIKSSS